MASFLWLQVKHFDLREFSASFKLQMVVLKYCIPAWRQILLKFLQMQQILYETSGFSIIVIH